MFITFPESFRHIPGRESRRLQHGRAASGRNTQDRRYTAGRPCRLLICIFRLLIPGEPRISASSGNPAEEADRPQAAHTRRATHIRAPSIYDRLIFPDALRLPGSTGSSPTQVTKFARPLCSAMAPVLRDGRRFRISRPLPFAGIARCTGCRGKGQCRR